jgi:hypothetical protein
MVGPGPMNNDEGREQFSVFTFDADGRSSRELSFVSAERAVTWAKWLTEERAARFGEIVRVIIVDGGDLVAFEWRFGEGVVFPPRSTS